MRQDNRSRVLVPGCFFMNELDAEVRLPGVTEITGEVYISVALQTNATTRQNRQPKPEGLMSADRVVLPKSEA
jgi:hypothetical protein